VPNVLDLFAGCGGFSLGFYLAGYNVIAHADFDKSCCNTLKLNFKSQYLFDKDVRDMSFIDWIKKLPKIDVMISGPPCQGFSVAGSSWMTKDRNRTLNNLYLIPAEIAEHIKPKVVVIENVPAVLYSKNIPLVALAIFRLNNLGYSTFPSPPPIEPSLLEGFNQLGESVTKALIKVGVYSKKKLLSNPDLFYSLYNNLSPYFSDLPKAKQFVNFYNKYWIQISNNLEINNISKTRINIPKRMKSFLERKGVKVKRTYLENMASEVDCITSFLEKNGLLLDNISLGSRDLLLGLKASKKLGLNILLPEQLECVKNELDKVYYDLLKKINKWAGSIRKKATLKSEFYESPERRHRVFIIAYLENDKVPTLPKPKTRSCVPLEEVLGDLPKLIPGGGTDFFVPYPKVKKLTNYQKEMRKFSKMVANHRARSISDPLYLLRYSMMYPGANDLTLPFYLQKLEKQQFTDSWRRLDGRTPSKAIVAHLRKDGNAFLHPYEERTITVREAARIQGFPDSFIFPVEDSFSTHFQQIGNALCIQVAKAIAKHIGSELKYELKDRDFKGPDKETLQKHGFRFFDCISESKHEYRGFKSNENKEYEIRKLTKGQAEDFISTLNSFRIGFFNYNLKKRCISFELPDFYKIRDNIGSISLKKKTVLKISGLRLKISEIFVNSNVIGYLGVWSQRNGKESWFSFFKPHVEWPVRRYIVSTEMFPSISDYLMMNQSRDFFLTFIGSMFGIDDPVFLENSSYGDETANLEKHLLKNSKLNIKKFIISFNWNKLNTKVRLRIDIFSMKVENVAVRILMKVDQAKEILSVEEIIVSDRNRAPNLKRKFDRIVYFDRIKSNLMDFLSHLKLLDEGLISKEELAYYWGENVIEEKDCTPILSGDLNCS